VHARMVGMLSWEMEVLARAASAGTMGFRDPFTYPCVCTTSTWQLHRGVV
jgi:hypothetical protein